MWSSRLAVAAMALLACGDPAGDPSSVFEAPTAPEIPNLSRDASPDLVAMLRNERIGEHPSDGGGRAWLRGDLKREGPAEFRAGARSRLVINYEVGPLGIAVGGSITLRIPRHWDWDEPQIDSPEQRGFTIASTSAEGVSLRLNLRGQWRVAVHIQGRALVAGERVRIIYGAGNALSRLERYAERGERAWLAVDGDGDGAAAWVEESPRFDMLPGPPHRLILLLPATARPGDAIQLRAALLDRAANAGVVFVGEVELSAPAELGLPARISFRAEDRGVRRVTGRVTSPGVFRVHGTARTTDPSTELAPLTGESNPVVVDTAMPRVLWADLHGHSQVSDGTGTPDDYFRYARDVGGLDVVALTDHDHWGVRYLDENPEAWQRIREATMRHHEPGVFVTLLGFEWTSWLHGHRHVLYFSDEGEILSAMDPATETPDQLWRALANRPARTFSHHSAGFPISTNWRFIPDPRIEPVAEIVSIHGNSESPDGPNPIRRPVEGNFIRDILDRGVRFGFIGSGDGHDGHPGMAHLDNATGGLAALVTEDRSRRGVLAALDARSVYATNGARIVLHATLDGHNMGSQISAPPEARTQELVFRAAADQAPFQTLELIRGGKVVETLPGESRWEWSLRRDVPSLAPGEYLYLRIVQEDDRAAWSSPFYGAEPPDGS